MREHGQPQGKTNEATVDAAASLIAIRATAIGGASMI